MKAIRRRNATGMYMWIGSDGWSARAVVFAGKEEQVEGTLCLQPQANPVKGFYNYFRNLTVFNNGRNPWFKEYWEHWFSCKFADSLNTPWNIDYEKECTGYEQYEEKIDFEDQLQFVSDAVLAFAYGLKDMHADVCGGRPGLCDEMNPVDGNTLLHYLRRVKFTGISNCCRTCFFCINK